MTIGFVLFENYHQKKNTASSRIRGRWVIKYLNRLPDVQAEEFVQGKTYDVIIFQKAYWKEMAREFKGIKVLDICDPDWLEGAEIVNFCQDMDFITVPTEALKETLAQYTDKPIYILPDSEDLEILPPPRKHEGKAKTVVWFGYSHNLEALFPTFYTIKKMGLRLLVVTDGHLNTNECDYENIKWDPLTCDQEYQRADFALLPEKKTGRYRYKSNNKTIHAKALGLPVAKTPQEMELYMSGEERQKAADEGYKEVVEKYSTKLVAEKLYQLISELTKSRS